MAGRKHLFITLSSSGWGETSLGIKVARQMRDIGDTVSFVAHTGSLPAFTGSGFQVREVADHLGPLVEMVIDDCVTSEPLSSIVLSDFLTANYTLKRLGVDAERLLRYDVPIIALDTWEYDATGAVADILGIKGWEIGKWIEKLPRLIPVPIGRPTTPGGYNTLSASKSLPRSVRRHIRQNLGVKETERAVLFCTAKWQHEFKYPEHSIFPAPLYSLPELLWNYLLQVGPEVKLIHVGPKALPLDKVGDRYLWMPSVSPNDFDRLLGSVDLVLSANISATTIGSALAFGVPVLVVQNSYQANTVKAVETYLGHDVSPAVRTWLEKALPLYPFSLWPLGYWHFLEPLLCANPYCSAIEVTEMMNEPKFVETCRRLLDEQGRHAAIERQTKYMERVQQLPTAAELMNNYLQ